MLHHDSVKYTNRICEWDVGLIADDDHDDHNNKGGGVVVVLVE